MNRHSGLRKKWEQLRVCSPFVSIGEAWKEKRSDWCKRSQ
ncbi:hypothetical protein DOY81_011191 [Sarcophaga bullata]|nr:hypothetical protein DOY81_011191 [Sarcophaga bullata]